REGAGPGVRAARRPRPPASKKAAPRESASIPSPPLPAKRSRTRAPRTAPRCSSMPNSDSRSRLALGRTLSPRGTRSARPLASPAITRRAPPFHAARGAVWQIAAGGARKEHMIWAIVPAKPGADAKRRLAPVLAPAERERLAQAMLRDVLTALRGARCLAGVAVIG